MASNLQQFNQNANDVTAKQLYPRDVCLCSGRLTVATDTSPGDVCSRVGRITVAHNCLSYSVRLNSPTMSSVGSRRLERMLTAAFSSGFQFGVCSKDERVIVPFEQEIIVRSAASYSLTAVGQNRRVL